MPQEEPLDYEKHICPVVQKYSGKPTNEMCRIIEDEAKKLFADTSTEELAEIYRRTNHQWLVSPELNRRKATEGQLSLFGM